MSITVTRVVPVISAASIAPNPASINSKVVLTVSVVEREETVVYDDPWFYSGDIFSGEV